MKLALTFAALLLSTSLLPADLTRTEISIEGAWTLNAVKDDEDHFIQSEMVRTFDGKHEIHLRIGFDGGNFQIDSSGDWSDVPDARSHKAEYRINDAGGVPAWKGKATVMEDADGMSWLRITEPNEPGVGDVIANGEKLIITVGTGAKAVEWVFDLKGSNAAFKAMVDQYFKGAKPAKTADSGKTVQPSENDYARLEDWTIHYYTDSKGKFVSASMIRFYDNGDMMRLTRDATHFHLDTLADMKKLAGAAKDKATGNLTVAIGSDEPPDDDSQTREGSVIDEGGDKWLRISQSYEEPGGLEDGIRNSKTLHLKFSNSKMWSFDLKGSHAARKKLDECFDKFSK